MIRLRTLGGIALERDDGTAVESVTAQPKRLALLVYLAAARPRGFHQRDTLLGMFWPESAEERARSALGQSLYFLRRSLGSEVIVGRGDEIAVDATRLWCDAVAVHDAIAGGRMDEGLELYRGDLLPGLYVSGARGFEEWLENERTHLRRTILDAVRDRVQALEAVDPRRAADLLRRALGVASEDEILLRRLMTLLDAAGDRAGALAAFDEFARRLMTELEIEPAPETLALRNEIVRRTTPHAPPPPAATPVSEPPSQLSEQPAAPPIQRGARVASPAGAIAARHRGRWWIAAAVGTSVVIATSLLPRSPAERTAAAPSGFTLAVVPFTPAAADTGLLRIARELVVPLSANLDGLGDVRAVEGVDVLAAARAVDASGAALELAGRLGASRVLYGALVATGAGVRVEATLRRVSDGARILRATVVADRDVSVLADSLTWAVLRELWSGRVAAVERTGVSPPEPAAPALATQSLAALRAYWEGERALYQDRWNDAAALFYRAMELDSMYWFAYWRYGYARTAVEAPVEPRIRAAYESQRFGFPERDRLLIEARMGDSLSEVIARHRAITRSHPAYWLGWWDYANRLVHDGPLLGSTGDDARAALEQALALRPNDVIVLQHLFWMAAERADTATMAFVVRRTRELRDASPDFVPPHPDYLLLFDLTLAAARGDDRALAIEIDRNIAHLAASTGGINPDRFAIGPGSWGYHRAQIEIARSALAADLPSGLANAQHRALTLTWAARGAWDSAMVAAARYADASEDVAPLQHMLRLAVAGEWLGALDHGTAEPWRARLVRNVDRLEPLHRAELAWLDGVRAAAYGTVDSIAAARHRLRELAGGEMAWTEPLILPRVDTRPDIRSVSRMFDASLRAFELAARGDTVAAATAMAELERQRAEHGWAKAAAQWHPYLTGIDRLGAARWLRATGRADRAETLLAWHEAVEVPGWLAGEANALLDAVAYFERGRIAEALLRNELAHRHYTAFLRRYDMPVSAHAHLVEHARTFTASARR